MVQEIESAKSEKEALQRKIISAEEQCRTLLDRARLSVDLQKAYEDLRQTQQTIMQQERLRALGQMASGIVHDINNALSPIVAFPAMILKSEPGVDGSSRRPVRHHRTVGGGMGAIA